MGREERQREWEIEKEIWWRRVKISDMDSDSSDIRATPAQISPINW